MAVVKTIKKIKNTGILYNLNNRNLTSPDLDFKKINLIFGWNGTGKTTLSRVFRSFELGEKTETLERYENCEFQIELDSGILLDQKDFSKNRNIRVFNKDFISENIFQDKDNPDKIKAIYYLGSEKIELTKERKQREEKKGLISKLDIQLKSKKEEQEKFEKDSAKIIKNNLLGIKNFQHYFKNNFIESFKNLKEILSNKKKTLEDFKLTQDEFQLKLRTVKNSEILIGWLDDLAESAAKIDDDYLNNLNNELLRKIVSIQRTIEKLKNDPDLSKWIQEGLSIHQQRDLFKCEFCLQDLPSNRIENLEEHFNKDYISLINNVGEKIKEISSFKIKDISKVPNDDVKKLAIDLNEEFDYLIKKLKNKEGNILKDQSFDKNTISELSQKFSNIKKSTDDLSSSIASEAVLLEKSSIADFYEKYNSILKEKEKIEVQKQLLEEELEVLEVKIKEGENSILDFNLPAEQINNDIESFLGHSELQFESNTDEFDEVYYLIKRNGEPAFNLSEGEKTAISLIYFLKKLEEDGFSPSDGIVFIDDPISSMDSQFLYSSYSYIISSIEKGNSNDLKIGQFILSTHNFDFLNLFKKKYWQIKYSHNPSRRRCEMFMFKVYLNPESERCSNLYLLDNLLRDYDSDYHYLYSILLDFERSNEVEQGELETIYPFPNIARRVLETFLSFKFPAQKDLQGKFNVIKHDDISKQEKESIYRFINIKSHGTLRESESFAPEVLDPMAKNQILGVLKIMRILDPTHCQGME